MRKNGETKRILKNFEIGAPGLLGDGEGHRVDQLPVEVDLQLIVAGDLGRPLQLPQIFVVGPHGVPLGRADVVIHRDSLGVPDEDQGLHLLVATAYALGGFQDEGDGAAGGKLGGLLVRLHVPGGPVRVFRSGEGGP